MAESISEFDIWLRNKLFNLNTDDEVFSPYIKGILESDDLIDEKKDALTGILAEIVESDTEKLCSEFMEKWKESCIKQEEYDKKKEERVVCIEDKFAMLLENSKPKTNNIIKVNTSEKEKLKKAILEQYAEVSEEDLEEEEEISLPPTRSANVEAVHKAERAKREQDKEASHKKKEKDKEDRSKQKSKNDERKEKEKKRTQKGEKRR